MNETDYISARLELVPDMIKKMKPTYVASRKELTDLMIERMKQGFVCFRIRTHCKCRPAKIKNDIRYWRSNQHNALIVLNGNRVKQLIVYCKPCAESAQQTENRTFRRFWRKVKRLFKELFKK